MPSSAACAHTMDLVQQDHPKLAERLAQDKNLADLVVYALATVVDDWWEGEGVSGFNLDPLCRAFLELIEKDYLANGVTLHSLVPPLAPSDLDDASSEPSRVYDEWCLETYQRFLDGRDRVTKSGFTAALLRIGVLARKGWERTFYRDEGGDLNGPQATT